MVFDFKTVLFCLFVAVVYTSSVEASFPGSFFTDPQLFRDQYYVVDGYFDIELTNTNVQQVTEPQGYFSYDPALQQGSVPLLNGYVSVKPIVGGTPQAVFDAFDGENQNKRDGFFGTREMIGFLLNAGNYFGFYLDDYRNPTTNKDIKNYVQIQGNNNPFGSIFYSQGSVSDNNDEGAFIGFGTISNYIITGLFSVFENVQDRSVEGYDINGYAFVTHFLANPQYIGAGDDPHVLSVSELSEMKGVFQGDIVNLIDHEHVFVNSAIREFEFLPTSMRENNFFGSIGMQFGNGDRLKIQSFEDQEGLPSFLVLFNDQILALHSTIEERGFELRYDYFENLPRTHGKSWFQTTFPEHNHHAIVRVHIPGQIVVDVSLSSKRGFVDWHADPPTKYLTPGAFLNINLRELNSKTHSKGLLSAIDNLHKVKHSRKMAKERGVELTERDIDVDFEGVLTSLIQSHIQDTLF